MEIVKQEESALARLIRLYQCPTDNHQCWKIKRSDGGEDHYRLSNDVLSDWAFEIVGVSGHCEPKDWLMISLQTAAGAPFTEIPTQLMERALKHKVAATKSIHPPDAQPKQRGMNGCVPTTMPSVMHATPAAPPPRRSQVLGRPAPVSR